MAQPLYRLTISRKDKEEIEFKDYTGKKVSKKHKPVGAIFEGDEGRLFIAAKEPFKYDPEEHWLNIFAVEPKEDDDEDEKPKKKAKGKPAPNKGRKNKSDDDEDGSDPFED